jgi:hypothetical protein
MFSLAETLLEVGREEEAEAFLIAARSHAHASKDTSTVQEIEEMLDQIRRE